MNRELFESIAQWQRETFPNGTPLSALAHLKKEVAELQTEIERNPTSFNVLMELCDCIILLIGIADRLNISHYWIESGLTAKHNENISREWGDPDKDGIIEHKK